MIFQHTHRAVERIATIEAQEAASHGATLEERLRLAMNTTAAHYLMDGCGMLDGVRVRAACMAVVRLAATDERDRARIFAEHRALATVSALVDAVEKGLLVVPPDLPELAEPIGLLAIWNDVKASRAPRAGEERAS